MYFILTSLILAIAQGISISHKAIINRTGKAFWVRTKPQIHFNDSEPGQAILYFPNWQIVDMLTGESGFIDESDIVSLEIKATLPRYNHASENIESDLHDIKYGRGNNNWNFKKNNIAIWVFNNVKSNEELKLKIKKLNF